MINGDRNETSHFGSYFYESCAVESSEVRFLGCLCIPQGLYVVPWCKMRYRSSYKRWWHWSSLLLRVLYLALLHTLEPLFWRVNFSQGITALFGDINSITPRSSRSIVYWLRKLKSHENVPRIRSPCYQDLVRETPCYATCRRPHLGYLPKLSLTLIWYHMWKNGQSQHWNKISH